MSFEVQLNKRAKRDLQGLAPGVQAKVISGLREFRTNPFAGDHKKLRGVRDGLADGLETIESFIPWIPKPVSF